MSIELNRSQKGLSQILYLIIAAAVLMMVAMSLLFGFSGSSDTSSIDRQACTQALRAQCSTAASGEDIELPGTCISTDNSGNENVLVSSADPIAGVSSIDTSSQNFQCN
jgi:hypothetical protein